jgi:hypothetical protein
MSLTVAALALLMVAQNPPTLAIVGIGSAEGAAAAVQAAIVAGAPGHEALSTNELRRRLLGTPTPRTPDVQGLTTMLADASDREARFDSAGAAALRREVLRAFDEALTTGPEMRQAALAAMLDMVAALVGDKQGAAALAQAQDTVRRFGEVPVDSQRYPPIVRNLVAAAADAQREQPHTRLDIHIDTPGEVFADGTALGGGSDGVSGSLPLGSYRVWLVDVAGRSSWPHPVTLSEPCDRIQIELAFDQLIDVDPVLSLQCTEACDADLQRLGQRLGVTAIVGLRPDADGGGTGTWVDVATGETAAWKPGGTGPAIVKAAGGETTTRSRFSPLYLVPLGVGQFAQDRPGFGASYAALELGLLAWSVVAWRQHVKAVSDHDLARESRLRTQRNLSAGLFYGSLVAGVVEAVVVGWVTGEP